LKTSRLIPAVALCLSAVLVVIGCSSEPMPSTSLAAQSTTSTTATTAVSETETTTTATTPAKTIDEDLVGEWQCQEIPQRIQFGADGTFQVTYGGEGEGTYTADGSTLVVTLEVVGAPGQNYVRTEGYDIVLDLVTGRDVLTLMPTDGSPRSHFSRVQ
jgi:hypothetical protein